MSSPAISNIPLLIHALSVRLEDDPRVCRVRATIRAGSPDAGQVVYFEGLDRVRHELTIRRVRDTHHLWTIWLEGEPEDISSLLRGAYLHGY